MNLQDPTLLRQACLIDGEWLQNKNVIQVHNPANQEVLGSVPNMGEEETRSAIIAANTAFLSWKKTTARVRSDLLRKWFELMHEHAEDLAMIMTLEQGKPLVEAKGEVVYGASFLEWFAEEARRVYGDTIPHPQDDKRIIVTKQPIGVCALITPWNFPLAMITRKAGAALAAGCSVVIKPAKETPFSALALGELANRAGIPKGVVNIITGQAAPIGGELTSNPLVQKLSFTGSTEVGRLLMSQSSGTIKKLSLELGGNAPFIVFDDANIEAAVEGAMIAKYRNTGQTCVCANRIYVQEGVYEEFASLLAEQVQALKVGNGIEEGIVQGPLINQAALDSVTGHISDALSKGGKVLVGGQAHELGGTFFQPTVMTNMTTDMAMSNEEIFGPVAPLFKFTTEEAVIELANDTEFGLAAYFYSQDISRVWRVQEALEYGIVGVNTGLASTVEAPFGGVKQSGLGREGSMYGIEDYLEIKYVCLGGL